MTQKVVRNHPAYWDARYQQEGYAYGTQAGIKIANPSRRARFQAFLPQSPHQMATLKF